MRSWLPRVGVFVIAGVAYLAGQYFRGYWWPYTTWPFPCQKIISVETTYCNPVHINTFGFPLITLGEFLAVVGFILLFANERGLRAWFKFSLFFVPIAAALVLWIYPFNFSIILGGSNIVPLSVGVSKAGWLYTLATLSIVLYTRFRPHRS